jgi:hypothetical protein
MLTTPSYCDGSHTCSLAEAAHLTKRSFGQLLQSLSLRHCILIALSMCSYDTAPSAGAMSVLLLLLSAACRGGQLHMPHACYYVAT